MLLLCCNLLTGPTRSNLSYEAAWSMAQTPAVAMFSGSGTAVSFSYESTACVSYFGSLYLGCCFLVKILAQRYHHTFRKYIPRQLHCCKAYVADKIHTKIAYTTLVPSPAYSWCKLLQFLTRKTIGQYVNWI